MRNGRGINVDEKEKECSRRVCVFCCKRERERDQRRKKERKKERQSEAHETEGGNSGVRYGLAPA